MNADGDGVRRGLVLGAGGVLGFTWMVAALSALEQEEGFDARSVDVCIGTSAGSILAAVLGCGVGVDALLRHQHGIPLPTDPGIGWDHDRDSGGAMPPRPGIGVGSPPLLLRAALHPRRVPPLAAASALLPRGRGTLQPVERMVEGLADVLLGGGHAGHAGHGERADSGGRADCGARAGQDDRADHGGRPRHADGVGHPGRPERAAADRPLWPVGPRVWVVAMDYGGGKRVAFGQDAAPPAKLSQAVTASCAIPGWYAPVVIGDRRYVDGGTSSPTSVDLLAGLGLDEVYVLAPMASFAYDRPRSPAARMERRWRRTVTRRVLAEAATVRDSGTSVMLLGPGPDDLRAMGANLMNPRRRAHVLTTSLRTSPQALYRAGPVASGHARAEGAAR